MKILHLNTYEKTGGAAIAANRLHLALNERTNHSSIMGVLYKQSDSELVFPLQMYKSCLERGIANRLNSCLTLKLKTNNSVYCSSYLLPNRLVSAIASLKPDLIHLHWIAHFISPWVLERLATLKIPAVWTLHDTWAFTGGCHYYGKCNKWQIMCEDCPVAKKKCNIDMMRLQWKQKQKAYTALNPTIVPLSKFFQNDVRQSSLLNKFASMHMPNTLNTNMFRPIDKNIARDILGLKRDIKYILFGADSATKDVRKGYDLLLSALVKLPQTVQSSAHCLVFGATHGDELSMPTTFLGRLNDITSLTLMYSAADVFVCPSREDNLPNTIMESLACGTPVVGFDIGGIPDMVQHQENGYVAQPYDTQDLADGINFVLEDTSRYEVMSKRARQVVEERYSYDVVAKQYVQLYEQVLSNHKK